MIHIYIYLHNAAIKKRLNASFYLDTLYLDTLICCDGPAWTSSLYSNVYRNFDDDDDVIVVRFKRHLYELDALNSLLECEIHQLP